MQLWNIVFDIFWVEEGTHAREDALGLRVLMLSFADWAQPSFLPVIVSLLKNHYLVVLFFGGGPF